MGYPDWWIYHFFLELLSLFSQLQLNWLYSLKWLYINFVMYTKCDPDHFLYISNQPAFKSNIKKFLLKKKRKKDTCEGKWARCIRRTLDGHRPPQHRIRLDPTPPQCWYDNVSTSSVCYLPGVNLSSRFLFNVLKPFESYILSWNSFFYITTK